MIEECNKHGGVLHIYVDKASPQGNVYVKCPSISAAVASVNALHGRYFAGEFPSKSIVQISNVLFAGKVITAAYVPLPNYHSLFPDSIKSQNLVLSSQQQALGSMGYPMWMNSLCEIFISLIPSYFSCWLIAFIFNCILAPFLSVCWNKDVFLNEIGVECFDKCSCLMFQILTLWLIGNRIDL